MDSQGPARLVVFDFDGTVADTWRDIATALNQTLADAKLPEARGPEVRSMIGDGARKLLERAVPPDCRSEVEVDALYEVFSRHYHRCCLETTELYPGVEAALDELSPEGLAICSNKPGPFLDKIVEGLGLKGRFRVVLGGDALPGVRKPDRRVLEHLISRAGFEPDEVWMVGDSGVDVQTGKAVAARTVGCSWGLRGREELRAAGPDFLIDHPREIVPVVLGRR